MIAKTLSEDINYGYFVFFGQKCVFFNKNSFISLEARGPLKKQQFWVNKTFSENLSLIWSFF